MTIHRSVFFNRIQCRSLMRLGDLFLPGDEQLPSFSGSGCVGLIDDIVGEIDSDDRRMLGWFLYLVSITPAFLLRRLLSMQDRPDHYPPMVATFLRLTSLATKGIVMSLYFSGLQPENTEQRSVLEVIDYQLHCELDDASSV